MNTIFENPSIRPVISNIYHTKWYIRTLLYFKRKVKYVVTEDYYFTLPNGVTLFIPKGFIFDGASIPKFLWPVLAPIDVLLIAAIFHDFAYRYQTLLTSDCELYLQNEERYTFDKLFQEIAIYTNRLKVVSNISYALMSTFSWYAWYKNRKENKCINIDFPQLTIKGTI